MMEEFAWNDGTGIAGGSTSTSADRKVRLTVLGARNCEAEAGNLLAAYLHGAPPVGVANLPEIGYVILDARKPIASATVVASPIALKLIYWSVQGGTLQIASDPSRLAPGAPGRGSLAPDAIFQYVYFHHLPGPSSAFEGVYKLAAGHKLEWDGTSARVSRYWQPDFSVDTSLTCDAAMAHLRVLLEDAVRRALDKGGRCGAFLSGGLDSSTVAGFAARIQPGISTVSMGFDAQGYDEIEYARTASSQFGTRPLEYYVTPEDVVRHLPDIAAAFPEPFGNSSAAAAFHCARIAREEGLETLLAGDGGDELFGGNERYATQLVFERYGRVPWPIRALLEPAVAAAARITTAFPVGKAGRYIAQARTPLPDRLQDYNFLHRIPPEDVFDPVALEQIDGQAPLRALREEFNAPGTASVINRMLFLDWRYTLHENDLVKVNSMCSLAGIKVAYPMLDSALVDFSMRLPDDWKVRGHELRWFYKKAMRGFLPDKIIDKKKHGFGLPFGVWTRTHEGLQRLADDALDALSRRRYFRPGFLANARRMHREGHAAYYGELVWILMVLELWLQRHMPRAGL